MLPTLTMDFSDQVVIVTEARSGIGLSSVAAPVCAGAKVLGVGHRDCTLAQTAEMHRGIEVVRADVAGDRPDRHRVLGPY